MISQDKVFDMVFKQATFIQYPLCTSFSMAGKVGLLIALHIAWFLSDTLVVTQQFVPALDSNKTNVCPGNASIVLPKVNLEQPNGVKERIPSPVLCAWKCSKTRNCTRFNWKEKEKLCELFTYVPDQCAHLPGCVHFQPPLSVSYNL